MDNPRLVLIQPRKTRPYITEGLLMGRKESNQTQTKYNAMDLYLKGWRNTSNVCGMLSGHLLRPVGIFASPQLLPNHHTGPHIVQVCSRQDTSFHKLFHIGIVYIGLFPVFTEKPTVLGFKILNFNIFGVFKKK